VNPVFGNHSGVYWTIACAGISTDAPLSGTGISS
jgi:hypothetical protein